MGREARALVPLALKINSHNFLFNFFEYQITQIRLLESTREHPLNMIRLQSRVE